MDIKAFRERINLFIYNSKGSNLKRLKVASILISLISIGCLLSIHGFNFNLDTNRLLQTIVEFSFGFYVFHYLAKIFYDFSPVQFIKKNWFEGAMVFLLILEGISYNLFDTLLLQNLFEYLGMSGAGALSVVFIQIYSLIVVFLELSDNTRILSNIKLHPSAIFIASFLVIIGLGTALLMMPEMATKPGSLRLIDALFTSVSATCVTGLAVVDTETFFTYKGQFVIMMLMKLGGLNIVSFAYLASFLNNVGFGLKQDEIIEDFITKDAYYNAKGMLLKVFSISILIEVLGALFIYLTITPDMNFETEGDKIFFGFFHSISAFNNGGFSTLSDGMHNPLLRNAYLMHVVVAVLMLLGGFGFTVMFDLWTPSKMRERLKHPWKRPSLSTILGVRTHLILVIIAAVLYMISEWNITLVDQNFVEKSITSVFQSISTRSAGLNTADVHSMGVATIFLLIILMFIGGNTFSTAGGIKTSTFALICISTYSVIRGKKNVEYHGRTIPTDIIQKTLTIFATFAGGMIISTYILCLSEGAILAQEGRGLADLLFEEVSAFGTCGLSTGITSMLSGVGKLTLIFSMFIGRLGTLSIIFAFARRVPTTNYQYPSEHLMVG